MTKIFQPMNFDIHCKTLLYTLLVLTAKRRKKETDNQVYTLQPGANNDQVDAMLTQTHQKRKNETPNGQRYNLRKRNGEKNKNIIIRGHHGLKTPPICIANSHEIRRGSIPNGEKVHTTIERKPILHGMKLRSHVIKWNPDPPCPDMPKNIFLERTQPKCMFFPHKQLNPAANKINYRKKRLQDQDEMHYQKSDHKTKKDCCESKGKKIARKAVNSLSEGSAIQKPNSIKTIQPQNVLPASYENMFASTLRDGIVRQRDHSTYLNEYSKMTRSEEEEENKAAEFKDHVGSKTQIFSINSKELYKSPSFMSYRSLKQDRNLSRNKRTPHEPKFKDSHSSMSEDSEVDSIFSCKHYFATISQKHQGEKNTVLTGPTEKSRCFLNINKEESQQNPINHIERIQKDLSHLIIGVETANTCVKNNALRKNNDIDRRTFLLYKYKGRPPSCVRRDPVRFDTDKGRGCMISYEHISVNPLYYMPKNNNNIRSFDRDVSTTELPTYQEPFQSKVKYELKRQMFQNNEDTLLFGNEVQQRLAQREYGLASEAPALCDVQKKLQTREPSQRTDDSIVKANYGNITYTPTRNKYKHNSLKQHVELNRSTGNDYQTNGFDRIFYRQQVHHPDSIKSISRIQNHFKRGSIPAQYGSENYELFSQTELMHPDSKSNHVKADLMILHPIRDDPFHSHSRPVAGCKPHGNVQTLHNPIFPDEIYPFEEIITTPKTKPSRRSMDSEKSSSENRDYFQIEQYPQHSDVNLEKERVPAQPNLIILNHDLSEHSRTRINLVSDLNNQVIPTHQTYAVPTQNYNETVDNYSGISRKEDKKTLRLNNSPTTPENTLSHLYSQVNWNPKPYQHSSNEVALSDDPPLIRKRKRDDSYNESYHNLTAESHCRQHVPISSRSFNQLALQNPYNGNKNPLLPQNKGNIYEHHTHIQYNRPAPHILFPNDSKNLSHVSRSLSNLQYNIDAPEHTTQVEFLGQNTCGTWPTIHPNNLL